MTLLLFCFCFLFSSCRSVFFIASRFTAHLMIKVHLLMSFLHLNPFFVPCSCFCFVFLFFCQLRHLRQLYCAWPLTASVKTVIDAVLVFVAERPTDYLLVVTKNAKIVTWKDQNCFPNKYSAFHCKAKPKQLFTAISLSSFVYSFLSDSGALFSCSCSSPSM